MEFWWKEGKSHRVSHLGLHKYKRQCTAQMSCYTNSLFYNKNVRVGLFTGGNIYAVHFTYKPEPARVGFQGWSTKSWALGTNHRCWLKQYFFILSPGKTVCFFPLVQCPCVWCKLLQCYFIDQAGYADQNKRLGAVCDVSWQQ